MNCPNCEKEMKKETIEAFPFPEMGLAIEILDCTVWKCACGEVIPEITNPEALISSIVRGLITLPMPLFGDAILFLRKRMGYTGAKLADNLGVNRVEVSRWENDMVTISAHMDFKIRMEAIEQMVPDEYKQRMKLAVGEVMHRLYKPESEFEAPLRVAAAKAGSIELAFA